MKKTSSLLQLMKRNSRSSILLCVGELSRASRRQIMERTGLKRAHVCEIVDELLASGELIEAGSVSAGRGRPATLLEVNPAGICAGGVWFAENSIEIGIAGATGEILARGTLPYSGDPLVDLDAITEALKACAAEAGRPWRTMRGVGVVLAGFVDPDLGIICSTTHDNGYVGVNVVRLLQDRVAMPVHIDTDIRAAALADQWRNARSERVLYISFCDGVGAAFVHNRELFGKENGVAPVVGHIIIDRNGPVCDCGERGCLQAYTSNYAFVRNLWPDLDRSRLDSTQIDALLRKGVNMAVQGDCDAIRALRQIANYIAQGIAITVNILDLTAVYVAGTLIGHMPDMMMNLIRREAVPLISGAFRGVEIKPLVTLQEFELRGAVNLVLLNETRSLSEDINARLMSPYSPKAGSSADDVYEPVVP